MGKVASPLTEYTYYTIIVYTHVLCTLSQGIMYNSIFLSRIHTCIMYTNRGYYVHYHRVLCIFIHVYCILVHDSVYMYLCIFIHIYCILLHGSMYKCIFFSFITYTWYTLYMIHVLQIHVIQWRLWIWTEWDSFLDMGATAVLVRGGWSNTSKYVMA